MNQYAMLYGIARDKNLPAVMTQEMALKLKKLFPFVSIPIYHKPDCPRQKEVPFTWRNVCREKMATNNSIVVSWFASTVTVNYHQDLLEKEFQFSSSLKDFAQTSLQVFR